ncbi:hypothetical protein LBMAG43_02560 [Methylococcaceae bacterium]|nr:hypothetical protein LBMAG43_02560 [Methylococcaceae bacterium]
MNYHILKLLLIGGFLIALSGCAHYQFQSNNYEVQLPIKKLTATGYGTAEKSDKFSRSQIKLMSIRSSKLDAYRSLSEQVYGVRLTGVTTVQNMIVTHDSYKSFVDAYLRGAKILRSVAINTDKYAGDDTFETVVEIELTPHFYECMNGSPAMVNACLQQPMPAMPESELSTPFSSVSPKIKPAETLVASVNPPAHCNSMDCYDYPVTSGFNRPLLDRPLFVE